MDILSIIDKQSNHIALTKEEIDFVVKNYTNGNIPDYQMASFLMAVKINGLTEEETFYLTDAMIDHSKIINWGNNSLICDKHSTGGIGDKTTLIIGPIVAACGCKFAKMAGRGLGISGGTIDKLESIEQYKPDLSIKDFIKQSLDIGVAVISQTDDFAVEDKKIYALRDVTGTTESLPLIAASIMSKKILCGAKHIFIDIKYGDGALIKNYKLAKKFNRIIKNISKHYDIKLFTRLSPMNEPLGDYVGNALEIKEAISFLKNEKVNKELSDLCYDISSTLIASCLNIKKDKALKMAKDAVANGSALEKMREWLEKQSKTKYDVDYEFERIGSIADNSNLMVIAEKSGTVKYNAKYFGLVVQELGGNRKQKEDKINHNVGAIIKKRGKVNKGDILAVFVAPHKMQENKYSTVEDYIYKAIRVT